MEEAKLQFLKLPPCCLDPFWAKKLQEKVAAGDMDFATAVHDYFSSMRPVSLREEQAHTIQRVIAGGDVAKAVLASNQRSQSLVYGLKRNFQSRGGRNLDRAPEKVARTYMTLRKGKQKKFARPNQFGNTMLYYCNRQLKLKGGTKAEHLNAWKQMPAETQAWWKTRHHNSVMIKRGQQKQEEEHASRAGNLPQANCTSWNLGSVDWPLAPETVKKWVQQFNGKHSGLQTLKQIQSPPPEVQSYIDAVESGCCQYHMREAMTLYCNHFLGKVLDKESVKNCSLTAAIIAAPIPSPGCHSLHPGMCKTRDNDFCSTINSLVKVIPKQSCVLQFKSCLTQVYARCVLGQGE